MAVKNKTPIILTFDLDDETKNTVRFVEQGDRESRVMGKVYVKKDQLAKWGNPKTIALTVTPK